MYPRVPIGFSEPICIHLYLHFPEVAMLLAGLAPDTLKKTFVHPWLNGTFMDTQRDFIGI